MKQQNKLEQFDARMRPDELSQGTTKWHSPKEDPFEILGLAWFEKEKIYRRFPLNPTEVLPEAVDFLADHPSGGQIRFQSNTTSLAVKVKLKEKANMVHMPATGQCGIDCYVTSEGSNENWHYVNTTKYDPTLQTYESSLFTDWTKGMRNIVLNLPLYQGVEEIQIGLDDEALVLAPPKLLSQKKVIFYGTSITQGGCATRPGMAYTNILSRKIPLEFINLGFSGSGKGEPEVAKVIAEIESPACLVLDYEANCVSTELFRETLPQFIHIYRKQYPKVPILVISRIPYANEQFSNELAQRRQERRVFQRTLVNELREQGDLHIYFLDGSHLLGGDDYHECTVDGSHPTDLGFLRMANAIEPILKTLLL